MPKNPQEFANLFGAKIVGEVPDVSGGPFGMARLAHIMHQRLTPSQGERPGRPTDSTWEDRPKVPMSEATQRRLAEIAAQLSTPQRRVSPMQVAAQLLEEAVRCVEVKTEGPDASEDRGANNRKTVKQRKTKPKQGRAKASHRQNKRRA
jgi:hypothetical protein